MLGVIRVLNLSAASKTVFLCAKTERTTFITARQRIGSTVACEQAHLTLFLASPVLGTSEPARSTVVSLLVVFLAGFAGFLVGDAPECRVQL